jgi:hypothetical protein
MLQELFVTLRDLFLRLETLFHLSSSGGFFAKSTMVGGPLKKYPAPYRFIPHHFRPTLVFFGLLKFDLTVPVNTHMAVTSTEGLFL